MAAVKSELLAEEVEGMSMRSERMSNFEGESGKEKKQKSMDKEKVRSKVLV